MHVSGFRKAQLKSRKPFWSFARSIHVIISSPVAKVNLSSPNSIKDMLLKWVKSKTKEYQNISIDNFSSSWANGLAFCALIHHFYPDAFDYFALNPKNRRANFELAFKVAEEKADICPLLEVDDMIMMQNKPDWKCVFTYVQSFYRRFQKVE
uniref:Calponin-homology (CH) domain-containing protein n=1 Tax=Strigamia maritima TaxID=126957 RepID=T1IXF8_STRMM